VSFIAFVVLSLCIANMHVAMWCNFKFIVLLGHASLECSALMQSIECWGGFVCAAKTSCNDLVARATRIHLFDVFAFGRKNFAVVAQLVKFEFFEQHTSGLNCALDHLRLHAEPSRCMHSSAC
jgi:hypothetical protein